MDSIKEAFAQTSKGRQILVDVKTRKMAIQTRREQVLDLIRVAFDKRPDIVFHARSVQHTAELINQGGPEYDHLCTALRFGQEDRRGALKALGLLKA